MYAYYYGYVPRERPPFSALNFRSQITKKSVTEHHHFTFFGGFAVPETVIFKISLISTRSSPPTAGSARLRSAAPRVSVRSGDSHFHAQNGSSSFRSPAFSCSKRLKLVPEPHIFTLDRELVPEPLPIFHFAAAHTYQNLGWVPPPPPPATSRTKWSYRAHTGKYSPIGSRVKNRKWKIRCN